MLTIENGSRVFQSEIVRGSIQRQLIFSGAIASLGVVLCTPLQAFSMGSAFTAILIAYQEYREYRQFRAQPIIAPPGKFNLATLEKINHVEPWPRTLTYCQAAMNICGGIYLFTHVIVAPGLMMTAIAGGSLIRLFSKPRNTLLHHEWVAIGIAGLAAELLKQSSNPIGLYVLSASIGYFGTSFLIKRV